MSLRRAAKPLTPMQEARANINALYAGTPLAVEQVAAASPTSPAQRRVLATVRAHREPIEKSAQLASPAYLAAVRELPCAFCGHRGAINAHHVLVRGRRQERNDLSAVPACGSGSMGCHGKAHDARLPLERQFLAIADTQLLLFRKMPPSWWQVVVAELAGGLS